MFLLAENRWSWTRTRVRCASRPVNYRPVSLPGLRGESKKAFYIQNTECLRRSSVPTGHLDLASVV
jgi:hypothetical protein